jgi:DNA-binding NarL/FixJ family response regulator
MVVDQHDEVCKSLAHSLDRLPAIKVVAYTTNLVRAAELALESPPDIILADFAWGVAPRPDILRWFATMSPRSRFVMYSSYYTDGEREAFQSAGASLCLLKGMSIRDLATEIRKISGSAPPGQKPNHSVRIEAGR